MPYWEEKELRKKLSDNNGRCNVKGYKALFPLMEKLLVHQSYGSFRIPLLDVEKTFCCRISKIWTTKVLILALLVFEKKLPLDGACIKDKL